MRDGHLVYDVSPMLVKSLFVGTMIISIKIIINNGARILVCEVPTKRLTLYYTKHFLILILTTTLCSCVIGSVAWFWRHIVDKLLTSCFIRKAS